MLFFIRPLQNFQGVKFKPEIICSHHLIPHFPVSNEGFCDAETNTDTPHGVYNWSETEVGMSDTNVCVYNTTEGLRMARRHCASPKQLDVYYGRQCISQNALLLQELIDVSNQTF